VVVSRCSAGLHSYEPVTVQMLTSHHGLAGVRVKVNLITKLFNGNAAACGNYNLFELWSKLAISKETGG